MEETHSLPFRVDSLLDGALQQHSDAALSVTGVCADSRAVRRGDAFFALPGVHVHGNRFAGDAVARGAAMLVTDMRPDKDPGVPVIVVPDVRAAFAKAAARSVGALPATLVGVTGTNGKTSVVSFVRQIWNHCGIASASLGTLGVDTGHRIEGGSLTTPDSLTLAHQLAALKADGIDHVAMEASSHGLDQRRLDGLAFKAVGFTNLTRDHLDYHETFDNYREAKLRLFRDLLADGGAAVVNTDDPEHLPFMFAALERGATLLTVGSEGAFISVDEVTSEALGQRVRGRLVGEPMDIHLPLAGQFQVSNALVAVALAIAGGAPQERAVAALEHLKGAKGRLELAGRKGDVAVFIDYAHTPDALKTALEALRPFARGKVTVVFGCGGDRDKGKRPLMGAIASDLADRVIVTDDNPRSEDAATIRREILAEAPGAEEIGDRAEAIRAAVAGARQGDVVLVAGKGHEDYQIVGETRLHFSDHETVRAALEG